MLGGKDSYLILGVALGFFGALAAFVYLDAAVVSLGYCGKEESYSICAREWIAALSGWAAFAGAAIALPLLAAQAKEARRQTEFAVGDADPEFRLGRNLTHPNVVLTVTNWNRRRMMLNDIRVVAPSDLTLVKVAALTDANGNDREITRKRLYSPAPISRYGLDGWVNRANEPVIRKFALGLLVDGEPLPTNRLKGTNLVIDIEYSVLGQIHEVRLTKANMTAVE